MERKVVADANRVDNDGSQAVAAIVPQSAQGGEDWPVGIGIAPDAPE
jgi:hypothetical protein